MQHPTQPSDVRLIPIITVSKVTCYCVKRDLFHTGHAAPNAAKWLKARSASAALRLRPHLPRHPAPPRVRGSDTGAHERRALQDYRIHRRARSSYNQVFQAYYRVKSDLLLCQKRSISGYTKTLSVTIRFFMHTHAYTHTHTHTHTHVCISIYKSGFSHVLYMFI